MMKKFKYFVSAILLVAIAFASCTKDDGGEPPQLPPKESMSVDFDEFVSFSNGKKSAMIDSSNTDSSMAIYNYSAVTVGVWNLLLGVTLAVPVASFYASFGNEPVYMGDNVWQWSYVVNGFGAKHYARLTGELSGSTVQWKMHVRKEGINGYPEFLWFEGVSQNDRSGGSWTLYHSYQYQDEVLTLDWTSAGNDSISQIKYTYVREQNNLGETDMFNGSYIEYGKQAGDYDAFYDIHYYEANPWWDASLDAGFYDVNIEWSIDEYHGRVKSEIKYKDTEWHCWDSQGYDTTCQ